MNWFVNSRLTPGISDRAVSRFSNEPQGARTPQRPFRTFGLTALGLLLAVAVLSLSCPAAVEAKPKKAQAAPSVATPTPSNKRFDVPIPLNRIAKGLRIPSYDENGKLRMFFNIDTALRVDEQHIRMTNLKIETYDEDGKPEMKIHMPSSLLDLKTNVVSSTEPVTVGRSDFEITGGHMTFNTQTRQGKFSGPTRTVVFNRDDLASASSKPEPAPQPAKP